MKPYRIRAWLAAAVILVATTGTISTSATGSAATQQARPLDADAAAASATGLRCDFVETTIATSAELHCMELFPTLRAGDARGLVELGRVLSPFGIAVTAEGRQRYHLTLLAEGLPDPAELGAVAYIAWVTTPMLDPVTRLGEVRNGLTDLGEVTHNKFSIWVSAESSADAATRSGRLVLRGRSPSSRMGPEDLITQAPLALAMAEGAADHAAGGEHPDAMRMESVVPPMHPVVPMVPGVAGLRPEVAPWLPPVADPRAVPLATPTQIVRLGDGGTLDLEAGLVRRQLGSRTYFMYGFNGQSPGPLIHVPEKATIFVNFENRTALPTAIHWHGVRLDNRFDGVPGVTQDAVLPGEGFRYQVYFRDAGIYWYHPHHREDIAQDLGLYGNMLVDPPASDAYGPVNTEQVLMLDDLLLGEQGFVPYGTESANFMLMGRFGNLLLVNGEPRYELEARRGEVVRFFFTNVANTRTFNLSFRPEGGSTTLPMKVIATDVSRFERQVWADSLVIAPAERYVVEVRFAESGLVRVVNTVQGINHRAGAFFTESKEVGFVRVGDDPVDVDLASSHATLRAHAEVAAEIGAYRDHFERPPDRHLVLRLEAGELPLVVDQLMALDRVYFNPAEWAGTMPMMNWVSTGEQIEWQLIDPVTGNHNTDIDDWKFRVGDVVKIRITNDRGSFHAMQHPMHFHGQRFLVLQQDGVANDNLAWKDTVLLPVASTTDLLLELSNPGRWMVHCHIAEHLESGMKMVFTVEDDAPVSSAPQAPHDRH